MKIIKKTLVILVLLCLAVFSVNAEELSPFDEFDNALGGFYGEIGGAGLSWQHWSGKLGVEVAAGLSYMQDDISYYASSWNTDDVDVDLFNYNVGGQFQYMLYQDSYGNWFDGNLYLFAGGQHTGVFRSTYSYKEVVYNEGLDTEYSDYPTTGHTSPFFIPGFAAGFGFGFETVFFDHFSLPFEIGLCGVWELGSVMPVDAGIKFQGGLRYRF